MANQNKIFLKNLKVFFFDIKNYKKNKKNENINIRFKV